MVKVKQHIKQTIRERGIPLKRLDSVHISGFCSIKQIVLNSLCGMLA